MQEPLEVGQGAAHLLGWRRHEHRALERRSSDPYRGLPQLAGPPVPAAHSRQGQLMHFPEQSCRQREARTQPLEPVLHGRHVVLHLAGIVRPLGREELAGLEPKELHPGPRPLDP